MQIDIELDTKGLSCPLPLLKAKQALNTMAAGAYLRVESTDAGSMRDFQSFIKQAGHTLHQAEERDGVFIYLIEKNSLVSS